jgi:Golgi apparatus protein 1
VKHKDSLAPECRSEVFRHELEADDDIRLNVPLFQKCLADKKQFCPDVPPGNAKARDCLVQHRSEPGFSAPCRYS